MSLLFHKSCFFCKDPFTQADLNRHIQTQHAHEVELLAQTDIGGPDSNFNVALQWAGLNSSDTHTAPVPVDSSRPLPHLALTATDRVGASRDRGLTIGLIQTGAGNSLKKDDWVAGLANLDNKTQKTFDPDEVALALCTAFVYTQASEQSTDYGSAEFTISAGPVPGSTTGVPVRDTASYSIASIIHYIKEGIQENHRATITNRSMARFLYPYLYANRNSVHFTEFNTFGTNASFEMDVPNKDWYLCVSFASGAQLSPSERLTVKKFLQKTLVDASPASKSSIDLSPQSLADAKNFQSFRNMQYGSAANESGSRNVSFFQE